jgi:4-amino-4-deoxy-L-arabinose transferase-like glycosyltransferase
MSRLYTHYILPYRKILILFTIALAARLGVFIGLFIWFTVLGHTPPDTNYPVFNGDSKSYFLLAQNLLINHEYSLSAAAPFIPENFRLPGYPFFLYLLGSTGLSMVLITIVQILLSSATVVLTYLIGKKFLSEKVAFVAALLLCIEPTTVFFSTFIMSDTLFVFTLMLSIYLFLYKTTSLYTNILLACTSGLLFGATILIRVIAQYLIPCLAIAYIVLHKKTLRPLSHTALYLSVFAISAALVVLPWCLRNYALYGVAEASATPYINFTQYNLPLFYAHVNKVPLSEASAVYTAPIPVPPTSLRFPSLEHKAIFEKMMHDSLEGRYLAYAQFHLIKTIPFFITDGVRDMNRITGIIQIPPDQTNFSDMLLQRAWGDMFYYFSHPSVNLSMLLIGSTPWIIISLLWLVALGHTLYARPTAFWFILFASGMVLYFALLTGPVTEHRYRMPAAPFMLLLATQGASIVWHILRRSKLQ